MLQAPLPSMPESYSLDEHLDDLEVPGSNLLQDFIMRSNEIAPVSNDTTPLSISNGYTSEESDYSVTTPSDEQMYSDMSFLQSADTSELVEVVADFVEDNDLTVLSPQQQRVFADRSALLAGKMIKGKTSKYRGVTQTSKSSWGAKYSAKRITNTCKTPDEAARAYDLYLKTNYPDKYAKFANFCVRCDRFVNPLGLPDFRNECACDAVSDGGSTEVESPPPPSDFDGDELDAMHDRVFNREMSHDSFGIREGSNLSISSLKFSFLDDSEPLFDEEPMLDGPLLPEQQQQLQQPTATGKPMKRDSLTMAVVESFSNDENLDQIIKEIDRSSLPKKASFIQSSSFSNNSSNAASASNSASTVTTDFNADEWQNLSEYFLADAHHDPVGLQHLPPPQSTGAMHEQQPHQYHQHGAYKKIHSLDFDPVDHMDHNQYQDIKQEYPSAMDVDDLASAFMPPPQAQVPPMRSQVATPTATLPMQTHSSGAFPARVNIQTPFLEKYWRNDRKNIQCFPFCPEHGDYYRVRIENLQHRCKGVCRAAVKAHITIPTTHVVSPSGLLLFARCNSTFSRNVALSEQPYLNATEIKNLQTLSAVGAVENFGVLADGSGVQFEVTFYPDVWKFEFDLPKKRRHGAAGGEPELEFAGSEFLYFFEIDVFYTTENTSFQRLGHAQSMGFQIGNTRTLLRQRNRMADEPSDSDRVLCMDAMPEKKKVKTGLGRRGRQSSILEGDEHDGTVSVQTNGKYADLETGKVWREEDDDDEDYESGSSEDEAADYGRYVSPKGAKVLLTGAPDAATVATMTTSGTKVALAAEQDHAAQASASSKSPESHSWSKLFSYSLVCIPLSLIFVPLAVVLLVSFLVLPPFAGAIVRGLDALSDMELRRANSSFISSDARFVLNRLDSGKGGKGMFRFHSQGAVWSRFVYFCGIKLIVSVVVVVPVLLVSIVGLVLFPIKAVSQPLLRTANAMALVSRDFTRKSVGKPLRTSNGNDPQVAMDAMV